MWTQCKALFWQWRGVAIATPSVALGVLLIRLTGLLQGWEWATYDLLLRLRPEEPQDARIAIVGITEEDYSKLKRIHIPDQVYAEVITKLDIQNPQVIALDDLRDQPVEPGHNELSEVFRTVPNILGIEKVAGEGAFETVPPPPALLERQQQAQAAGESSLFIGANDVIEDPDQVVRRGLISLEGSDGQTRLSLGFLAAATYLDAQGYGITLASCPQPWWQFLGQRLSRQDSDAGDTAPASCPPEKQWWQMGEAVFENFRAHDGGYVRAQDGGYQFLINYRNGVRAFDWIPISTVLEDQLPEDWATDRIIFIGALGVTAQDTFLTPPSGGLGHAPIPMPGVEVHAQQASQILSAVLDGRPMMRTWSEPMEILWLLLWSAIGAVVAWQVRYTDKNWWGYVQNLGSILLVMGALGAIAYIAILQSLWIPLVPPLIALMLAKFSITAYVARTAGDIRKTFGRYLTDAVVENLLENPEGLKMGGERRLITILTSDLRGFTALSERISPEEVVNILNLYLSYMADVITAYQGTIDEFMGDGILVLFGAPTNRPDDARRAVACAVAMQQAMTAVNQEMQKMKLPSLEMGIGINTGEVVVGNIGSEKRTKYGIVGSQVNLTYRIESYTTGGQILISPTTRQAAGADLRIDAEKEVMPKGVRAPIAIYDVGGIGGEYQLYLDRTPEVFYPLAQPIELTYSLLEGKHLNVHALPGKLVQLSARGAEIWVQPDADHPAPLNNLKFSLQPPDPDPRLTEDIYGKVKENPLSEQGFYLTFTAQPPAIAKYLQALYRELSQSG
ncbi:MAG: adenylate/guanylate cyclase domain-containing protein [Spirulina sp. SIO3F2]|nr:adenylate/guanylate cyclase domain-containing protein [Spirulina sp. SIO3F2]